jgi:hypothetical protein
LPHTPRPEAVRLAVGFLEEEFEEEFRQREAASRDFSRQLTSSVIRSSRLSAPTGSFVPLAVVSYPPETHTRSKILITALTVSEGVGWIVVAVTGPCGTFVPSVIRLYPAVAVLVSLSSPART